MPRRLIKSAKRLLNKHIPTYQFLYNLVTANSDYRKQRRDIDQYPSQFGGMWTDRRDYPEVFSEKKRSGAVPANMEPLLALWREQGYVIMEQAIHGDLIDRYLAELAQLKSREPSPLMVTAATLNKPSPYAEVTITDEFSVRIVDDYFFSEASRRILMDKSLMDFIELVFDGPPVLHQSLSFVHGSQQAAHQDTAFVKINSPMKLAAVWVALEDVESGSGELIYYPGSHRWEGFLFSGRFRHYDEGRDGLSQLEQWRNWIIQEAQSRKIDPVSFLPKKGDVFFWHAGLAHGGAKIVRPEVTRRSLVGHYCPQGVRPLYHYYQPLQRKLYRFGDYRYCSSYYR